MNAVCPQLSEHNTPNQLAMIIEENGGGIIFQGQIEDTWGSLRPYITNHHTGVDKWDLIEGIPGLASWVKTGKMIIRAGGTDAQREHAVELIYELSMSGESRYKDLLMALWFGWSWFQKWMTKRDEFRFNELVRRRGAAVRRG